MKIVWFSWKDKYNPSAGGAELVGHEIRKRLAQDGHEVILLTSAFPGAKQKENIEGYEVIRSGNRYTVYYHAWRYYMKFLTNTADIVIDEMNTVPFFARFYSGKKTYLLAHQLCREIWFYEMFFPLNLVGYLLEPIYLWLLRKSEVITISESTKKDLQRFGFKKENISIFSMGIEWQPIETLENVQKEKNPTLVSVGSIRSMKRADHIIKAYLLAKKQIPELELIVAGKPFGSYGQKVESLAKKHGIKFLGSISLEKKKELFSRAHLFLVASVKEGWGLVVTEANSFGTPAIGYDVDGLRDSIQDGITGLLAQNGDISGMSEKIILYFKNEKMRQDMPQKALESSRKINFENSYKDFVNILKNHG